MANERDIRYTVRTPLLLDTLGNVEPGQYISGASLPPERLSQLVADGHLVRADFDNAGNNPPDVEVVFLRKRVAELEEELRQTSDNLEGALQDEGLIKDLLTNALTELLPDVVKSVLTDALAELLPKADVSTAIDAVVAGGKPKEAKPKPATVAGGPTATE